MFEIVFQYVMPIISFIMGVYLFIKFYSMRNLVDKETVRLIKQVKTWWGKSQNSERWTAEGTKKNYKAASQKVGKRIKDIVPLGLLDEMTADEVHAYIMNEDTIKFLIKVRQLLGGEFKLPEMPDILKKKKDEFRMKPE